MFGSRGCVVAVAAISMVVACESDDGARGISGAGGIDSFGTESGSGGATEGVSDGGTGGTAHGADAADGAVDSGDESDPRFDLPAIPDASYDDGCAAVDFLFVIDNSISMQDQQNALKAAFPEFIATIQDTLPTTDYHIMVADTDAWGRCDTGNGWNGSNPGSTTCNNYIKNTVFEECDRTRGAGVVHPAGQGASNTPCSIDGGNRYIVEGQANLADTFSCVASVGLAGHPEERPLDGIVKAVSAGHLGPGGCNEGYLRDDAILVVTFISDDGKNEDSNTAQQAYDKVVAAKNGNADAVVVLGLINGGQSHWVDFIGKFGDHGIQGPVSSESYNQFFLDAVSTIADTCLDFEG